MKSKWLAAAAAVWFIAMGTGCSNAEREELVLSAAASLGAPLETLVKNYETKHPEVKVTVNLGASGTLQKQIEQGAPADLFWSAGVKQMDELQEKGLLLEGTRRDAAGNELVVVVPQGAEGAAAGLTAAEQLGSALLSKIALGTPETVPAGAYAQEMLTALGIWETVQEKAVYGKDVTQVLTYVERGDVEAGIVYRSDALGSQKVKIAASAPAGSHAPVVYPLAVLKASRHPEAAQEFADYLAGADAQQILQKAGFAPR